MKAAQMVQLSAVTTAPQTVPKWADKMAHLLEQTTALMWAGQ